MGGNITPEEFAAAQEYEKKVNQYAKFAMAVCDNKLLGITTPPHVISNAFQAILMDGEPTPENIIKR